MNALLKNMLIGKMNQKILRICRIDGCDKFVELNGQGGYFKYCGMHRTRLKKHKSFDIIKTVLIVGTHTI